MKKLLPAVAAATLALAAIEAGGQARPGERQVVFSIKSNTLANALDEWAMQTGFQIVSPNWDIAKQIAAPTLIGTFSAQSALERLLNGTPLTFYWLNDRAVSIRSRAQGPGLNVVQSLGEE